MIICCHPKCCCILAILISVTCLIIYIAGIEFVEASLAYEVKDLSLSATIIFNEETLLNETISGKNPPLICVDPTEEIDYIQACVQFSDLAIDTSHFRGCVLVKMYWMKIFSPVKQNLGCFKINFKEMRVIDDLP